MSRGARAVFFDRDGVLNAVTYREGRPASPRSPEELVIAAGAPAAANDLHRAGLRLFIVTNQPDVPRGLLDLETVLALNAQVRARVRVDDIAVCFHVDEDACACRKPKPGMLEELAARWGVDLSASYVIGDSWRDMEAGRRAGCATILLRRDYNLGTQADHTADTVAEAARIVLARGDGLAMGARRGKT